MGAWSDGAPKRSAATPSGSPNLSSLSKNAPLPPLAGKEEKLSTPAKVTRAVSRITQFEGPRGYSARIAVYFRYISYFLMIIGCSALTEVCTKGIPNAAGGGKWMFLSTTVIVVGGAISTLFYVNLRNEIIEKVRHYVFGISLLPGTLVALFLYATSDFLGQDAFGGTLAIALPIVFLCTVIIPALVFIKEMTGIRTMHQSRLDDEEAVRTYTRQDGLQR